ncbi:MAG: hypothetical protein KF757_12295 [Phycisphaeraceae bacterium]|nr:hypothetical protein [Phycisphaeraceae bacterium]MCW5762471.1 hypothetical protein [Phycisphaeraceae bacterium]
MIVQLVRRPIMLTVAGAFGCVALWSVMVAPMMQELGRKAKELESQQVLVAQGLEEIARAEVDPVLLMNEFKAIAQEYESLWAISGDSTAVYKMFDELALIAGVSIDRIEPSRTGVRTDDGQARLLHSGYVVELRGAYDRILAFIELTQTSMGLTRVTSVRMNPASTMSDGSVVHAHLVTEHVGVSGLFAAMKELP